MESILRTAHCLVMPVIIEAAVEYIQRHIVPVAPVQVLALHVLQASC